MYPEDVITLRLSGNPSRLSGKLQYAVGTYAFDFERYIDNELGVFTLPAEKELTVEYEAGEDAWIKLDPVSVRSGEGAYRVATVPMARSARNIPCLAATMDCQ